MNSVFFFKAYNETANHLISTPERGTKEWGQEQKWKRVSGFRKTLEKKMEIKMRQDF